MPALKEQIRLPESDDFESPVADDAQAARQRSLSASQRFTALGEMSAGLAHDFRNVLAVIQSAINLAERRAGDETGMESALATAREGIKRGTALTDRLLVFAKTRAGESHPEDVNAALENLKHFLDYAAGPDIRVRLALSPDLPRCRIDVPQFGTAILNLIVNARDAMPDGGEIRIVTDQIRLAETAEGTGDTTSVLVRVIDQGVGMPKDVRDRIFFPYFTTKGDGGTGLGIPQVASFMRATGGCVNVNSELGSGTSVDLYFPVHDSPGLVGTSLWRQLDRWANEGGQGASRMSHPGH